MDLSQNMLRIAKEIYANCEAYHDFLSENKISRIEDFPSEFGSLPITNKDCYIEKYSIEKRLLRNKKISDYYMICTSSGSTGSPTIWPRDYYSDKKAISSNLNVYKKLFHIQNKRTLVIVTFGLGAWTAGMLTSRLCWEMGRKYKLSVVTPGLDKEVAYRILKELGKYYDQTIITGYPPFIIDLVEFALEKGFDFKDINTKIHYTSAGLMENQREDLATLVSKDNSKDDVLGFYASSEAGIVGIETPHTVQVLSYVNKNQSLCNDLFGKSVAPTFVEYNPKVRYLEAYRGKILLTVNQPVPLIRYNTKDRGGLIKGAEVIKILKKYGYKMPHSILNKYFVYILGREDSVRLLSNIYIEDITYCLEKSCYSEKFTGKFKYGLDRSKLKNSLKLLVYTKHDCSLSKEQQVIFKKELNKNLSLVNPDFKMVGKGIEFDFNITYEEENDIVFKGGKFNYFL